MKNGRSGGGRSASTGNGDIAVVGAGYLGLVVAACLAAEGHRVTCLESEASRIGQLRAGRCPIYEPGLEKMVCAGVAAERLLFTAQAVDAVARAPIILLCVGTPSLPDGTVDLSQIIGAAEVVAGTIREEKTVVVKSTVPVGTAERIASILAEKSRYRCDVVSVPEFLSEGTAITDFTTPTRLVIGARTNAAATLVLNLYQPFVRKDTQVFITDNRSAELAKYAANAALAARLSLINELAKVADAVGADIDLVRGAVGADPRIGNAYMQPGVGFGGSCLPKDARALVQMSHESGVAPHMLEATLAVNDEQALWFVAKILGNYGGKLDGRRLAVWGLAFKPGTDDVREAVSLRIIGELLLRKADVVVFDPQAMPAARTVLGAQVAYATDMYSCLRGCEGVLVLTEWDEFRSASPARMISEMKAPVLFDGRNMYDPEQLRAAGFSYCDVGRSRQQQAGLLGCD